MKSSKQTSKHCLRKTKLTKPILDQIKNLVLKYFKTLNFKNPYKTIIIQKIKSSNDIYDIIRHVDYWQINPYEHTAKDYIELIINHNYDPTLESKDI